MPGWALRTGGGVAPTPLHPPLLGLVQWERSDAGLIVTTPTRVAGMIDQSGMGQDWQQAGGNPGSAPYLLGDDIDGIPLITFGVGGDANKGFDTTASFKDRFGSDMDGSHARTIAIVTKPIFSGAYNRMGGTLWEATSWMTQFFFDPTGIVGPANGAYAWLDTAGNFGAANNFTPQDGSALGPYNNVPMLVMWSSSGRPQLNFRINNTPVVLAPLTMPGAAAGASAARLSATGSLAYLGGFTENFAWDYDLLLNPPAVSQLVSYIQSRYPVIPVVP